MAVADAIQLLKKAERLQAQNTRLKGQVVTLRKQTAQGGTNEGLGPVVIGAIVIVGGLWLSRKFGEKKGKRRR